MIDRQLIKEIFAELPTLQTERLIFRKMALEDASDMFEYASDSELAKFFRWDFHKSVEDSQRYLIGMNQRYADKDVSEWGIVLRDTNKFIGTGGFLWWATKIGAAELAFCISRKYRDRGLEYEIIKEISQFGFDKMNLNRIEIRCRVENYSLDRILQRIGMTFEGIVLQRVLAKNFRILNYNLKIYVFSINEYYDWIKKKAEIKEIRKE